MVKKLYISLLIVSVFVGLFYFLQMGLKEKAISKIKWSHFENPIEVAESIQLRLRQEFKDHQVIMIGVEPGAKLHLETIKGWLDSNKEPGWKMDLIYIEPALPDAKNYFPDAIDLDLRQFEKKAVGLIYEALDAKKRMLVIAPHVYVSQVIKENPIERILQSMPPELSKNIMTLSFLPVLNETSLPCVSSGVDYVGQSGLGCLVQEKSFFFKRKKIEKKISGALDQYGLHDYIFFLYAH